MKRKSNTIIPWKRRGVGSGRMVVELWIDERWSLPHPAIAMRCLYDAYQDSDLLLWNV